MGRLREWAAENVMKINGSKYNAVCFMRTWVKDTKPYVKVPTISGSGQLQILGNNLTQQLNLG
jgi:hypothetical protein